MKGQVRVCEEKRASPYVLGYLHFDSQRACASGQIVAQKQNTSTQKIACKG